MKTTIAALTLVLAFGLGRDAPAAIEVDGRQIEVIDTHLHPGYFGAMNPNGKAFILESLPPFARLYAPALIERLLDPFAEHVGIRAQTEMAGVDRALLYAVYTSRTTGYYTNRGLERALADPRNEDGWAAGLASIDFDEFLSDGVAEDRLAALSSYFDAWPDRIVGIKLAHAHQAVLLDDTAYASVYQLASQADVPVLLHTGFSPFPGSQTEPPYYDPAHVEGMVSTYSDVDFVLSHVGQGDARAVESALDLAEAHDNVWLEISALGRPMTIGADGEEVSTDEPQYPMVLEAIRERDLVGRTIFGTDGPQFSGMVRRYVERMVQGMKDAGYTTDQIEAVMAGNARRLFFER